MSSSIVLTPLDIEPTGVNVLDSFRLLVSVAEPELFFAAPAPTFQKASAPLRLRCYML
jgi:hypothetical protein